MELEGENKIEIKSEDSLLQDKEGKVHLEDEVIRIRKEKIINFLKTKYNWIAYVLLTAIVWIAVKIRTRNLSGLKDITTGTWTLGPDLDPFLFLRWSEYIVEHGKLYALDKMRYVPLGHDTTGELLLHPYLMAWFHKIAVLFGSESVTYSAVIYPVFMFALTVIAFFLLTRKIFIDDLGKIQASVIGLIASFFLSVIPVILPRTIAGIPEKESVAFLFMFLSFYFFLSAWKSKKLGYGILLAILAGASTAGMALIWGAYGLIFVTIAPAIFIVFLIGNIDKNKLYVSTIWLITSGVLMYKYSTRYTLKLLLTSPYSGIALVVLAIIAFHILIFKPYLKKYFEKGKFAKIPDEIKSSLFVFIFLIVIVSIIFGPFFFFSSIYSLIDNLLNINVSRIIQTVAENKESVFVEWVSSFGPIYRGIAILFWLFFIGSVHLFYKTIKDLRKKEQYTLTFTYLFFLFAIIFSKYSGSSRFNGKSLISLSFYALGFILFLGTFAYYYYQYYKRNEQDKLKGIDIGHVMILTLVFLCINAARNAVRLIMILVPPVSVIVAYVIVASFSDVRKIEGESLKTFGFLVVGIIVLGAAFAGLQYYKEINGQASAYVPSIYTQQWQKAMAWVRENTPENAVFGHWWDYGYWIQSIGKRATVLDGGNAQGYWNYLMGRYALTGSNEREALEFLYAHNTTHFLIDSTDIGKYTAFSSIGSNANYDRRSWLSTFLIDKNQVHETKNSTVFVYSGGTNLDEDIVYENNESRIFLPEGQAGIGAVLVERDSSGNLINPPTGIFVNNEQQYRLPLRYAFANGKFLDFGSGIEGGIFLFPLVEQDGKFTQDGALLYLSKRTVKSQLARLYLYNEDNPYFKLVHSGDDFFVAQVKAQNPNVSDIIFFQGVRGPIRIWEIRYPGDIEFKEEYLDTKYPKELE